ncbi:YdcF family protein [Enterobacteriaceae bacterium 4M9]|nr:YdcF family protein [Enterobacteriaceae bacterium 4M9]
MMMMNFPRLSGETQQAINTLGPWLAQDAFSADSHCGADDVIILAGNAVIPSIDAACRLAANREMPLVLSGGIGHSTTFLYAAIAQHPTYNTLPTTGRPEAAILADIARRFWNVPQERIHIESRSTNCGENAAFSRDLLVAKGLHPQRVIVAQDPTMQRRTLATFARVYQDQPFTPEWVSYPGVVPEVYAGDRSLHFMGGDKGLWPMERYLSLILGEIPRLRDDEKGYGPTGKGFIVHVDIPQHIEQAWQVLRADPLLTGALQQRDML